MKRNGPSSPEYRSKNKPGTHGTIIQMHEFGMEGIENAGMSQI